MTLKKGLPRSPRADEVFPERPPRNNMQNSLSLDYPGFQTALFQHFGASESILVISEAALGWNLRQRRGILYPDLMIAFNVDRAAALRVQGIAIDDVGKPPDFVLEIASVSTARNDYVDKRDGYAAFGVPEYWRFDPTGGNRYPESLAGDRLVEGEYHPIPIERTGEELYRGHSAALNLDICWEHGQLRWYDPVNQSYILTHNDEREGRLAAEAEVASAQARVRELEEELRRRSR